MFMFVDYGWSWEKQDFQPEKTALMKNDSQRYEFYNCLQNIPVYYVSEHGMDSILRAEGQRSLITAMQWEGLLE